MRTGAHPLIIFYPQEPAKTTLRKHRFVSIQYDIQNNYGGMWLAYATEFTMSESANAKLKRRRTTNADSST
jgi:hypothetical protein